MYGRTSMSRMQRNANVPMRYRSAGLPPSLICLDGGVTVERETTTIMSTLTRMAHKRISAVRNVVTTNCISQCAIILTTEFIVALYREICCDDIQLTILLIHYFNSAFAIMRSWLSFRIDTETSNAAGTNGMVLTAMLFWFNIRHLRILHDLFMYAL